MNDNNLLLPGSILHDIYVVEKHVSSGGFGNTYKAKNTMFNEIVAIKEFFMADIATRDENGQVVVPLKNNRELFYSQMEKFKKEAQRIRKLSNPHIVKVHDIFPANGTICYVMDFIDGESLGKKMERQGYPMREEEVMAVLGQVLDALDDIHADGLWHLDIKPDNLMMGKDGIIRLIDFGASKQDLALGGSTMASAVAYTERFAPLEQMEQNVEKFGPWTDFYALGATMLNLLTNDQPPKPTDILDDPTPDKRTTIQIPTTVSDTMRKLILWMMQNARAARPQTVDEIRQFLSQSSYLNESQPIGITIEGPIVSPVERPIERPVERFIERPKETPKKHEEKKEVNKKKVQIRSLDEPPRLKEPIKKNRTPIIAAAVALVLCLIGWGVYSLMSGDHTTNQNANNEGTEKIDSTLEIANDKLVEGDAPSMEVAKEITKDAASETEDKTQSTEVKTSNPQEDTYKTNLAAARSAYKKGQYDLALSYLSKVPSQFAHSSDVVSLKTQAQNAKQKQSDDKKQQEQNSSKCRDLYNQAQNHYKNGRYDQALSCLNSISGASSEYAARSEVKALRSNVIRAREQLKSYE